MEKKNSKKNQMENFSTLHSSDLFNESENNQSSANESK